MARRSNYDKLPFVAAGEHSECAVGWDAIASQLASATVVCVECYPGVQVEELEAELTRRLRSNKVIRAKESYKPAAAIRAMLEPYLGDDRVFGRMNGLTLEDWFDAASLNRTREEVVAASTC